MSNDITTFYKECTALEGGDYSQPDARQYYFGLLLRATAFSGIYYDFDRNGGFMGKFKEPYERVVKLTGLEPVLVRDTFHYGKARDIEIDLRCLDPEAATRILTSFCEASQLKLAPDVLQRVSAPRLDLGIGA